MKDENKNTILWDKFKHTDPSYTKPFPKFGKTLTTIDPMYQVMTMTRVFGPVGKGWSYDAKYHYTDANVFAEVKIVYCLDDIWYRYGPISSVCALYKANSKLDDEAPKKALTDAMTKGFSHLGVSADVFLGMFDNSKYVSAMKEKFNGTASAEGIKVKVVNLRKDIKINKSKLLKDVKEVINNKEDKNDK
jgi:hypothetical protein|tara:strand:+ start:633 stop:1202 length:570 start_codon:yes stop_codon:yes gene_type:complete